MQWHKLKNAGRALLSLSASLRESNSQQDALFVVEVEVKAPRRFVSRSDCVSEGVEAELLLGVVFVALCKNHHKSLAVLGRRDLSNTINCVRGHEGETSKRKRVYRQAEVIVRRGLDEPRATVQRFSS